MTAAPQFVELVLEELRSQGGQFNHQPTKARYNKITDELGPIGVEIAKVTAKLGNATTKQMPTLLEKLDKLKRQKKDLLAVLASMRLAESEERKAEQEGKRN